MLKEIECSIRSEGVVGFVPERRVVLGGLNAGVGDVQVYFCIQLDSVIARRSFPG